MPEEEIRCVFDVIIYPENGSIEFALVKTCNIFCIARSQGTFCDIARV